MQAPFHNPWPHEEHGLLAILKWKLGLSPREAPELPDAPDQPAGWQRVRREQIAVPPTHGWRAVWLGHAGFLLQGDGFSLLIDPIFSTCCGPLPLPRLRRQVPPPCAIDDLPALDAVLLTHSHYDHLDLPTLRRLGMNVPLVVPEGHATWLRRKGFAHVTELPWFASTDLAPGVRVTANTVRLAPLDRKTGVPPVLADSASCLSANEASGWQPAGQDRQDACPPSKLTTLRVTATPAQHFTARTFRDRNHGHWCGWLVEGSRTKLWHAGDSGLCAAFREIGQRYGPIDFGMIPIGAYQPRRIMRPVHMNPEEAVTAFQDSRCRRAVAMHWGTFRLTDEALGEPPALLARARRNARLPSTAFTAGCVGEVWEIQNPGWP